MTQTRDRTSEQLTAQARRAVQAEPLLRGQPIFPDAAQGAVTLYGRVETPTQAAVAERAVLRVPGVYAVAQKLLVSAAPRRSDTDIAEEAARALARAPHVPESVRVTVHDRRVTLTGEVNWQYEREAACRAIDDLPGAQTVHNRITVRSGTMAADLEKRILGMLDERDPLAESRLTVTTNGRGALRLAGSVPTVRDRRDAETICWDVPGTTSVTNHLTVSAPDIGGSRGRGRGLDW
ncbi:Osmotically-inducible protein OsmY, contains BON domain [Nakamurella panacisegetis]|uniref:Osmotically-inducible protein OsmY, contains BON domain n=1 Tax=Nakamurella panacisegetis TaxID=1090615 RepID=A0A1H0SX04_9ACTN|nr:BON domain-containing protein [Nakamurella panacisegetis]SDP46392.1 Osmotically-inducible protein OsmY, contains BON domain [Nakamurella panacisegetis]